MDYHNQEKKLFSGFILKKGDKMLSEMIWQRTVNLLENTSMCALFYEKILISEADKNRQYRTPVFSSLIALFIFGKKLHVYLDQSDDHREYFVKNNSSSRL